MGVPIVSRRKNRVVNSNYQDIELIPYIYLISSTPFMNFIEMMGFNEPFAVPPNGSNVAIHFSPLSLQCSCWF